MMSTAPMDDPDSQELLSMQLKKKKKKAKKVDIASLDAEIEKLASEDPGVTTQNTTDSTATLPQPVENDQKTGSVLELDDELGLSYKKKKKKKKALLTDDALMVDATIKEEDSTPVPPPSLTAPVIDAPLEPLTEAVSQLSTVDYELPPKKKKPKTNIVFEGFEEQLKEVVGDVDDDNGDVDDIEPMDLSPWAGTDRDYTYEELLDRVFNIMKQKNPGMVERKTRLVMKPPQVMRVGARRTTFANFTDICKLLHRQPKHVFAFLLAELGTNGSIDGNNQLIIKGRFQQKQIETVLKRYIKEYVTCHTCRSPETILQRENRLFFLQCETCGSRCSVQSVKSGFQAVTNRAQMRSRQT